VVYPRRHSRRRTYCVQMRMLAMSVFEILCRKTDGQTDTRASEHSTHVNDVSAGGY